jgi:hypothetical protein
VAAASGAAHVDLCGVGGGLELLVARHAASVLAMVVLVAGGALEPELKGHRRGMARQTLPALMVVVVECEAPDPCFGRAGGLDGHEHGSRTHLIGLVTGRAVRSGRLSNPAGRP